MERASWDILTFVILTAKHWIPILSCGEILPLQVLGLLFFHCWLKAAKSRHLLSFSPGNQGTGMWPDLAIRCASRTSGRKKGGREFFLASAQYQHLDYRGRARGTFLASSIFSEPGNPAFSAILWLLKSHHEISPVPKLIRINSYYSQIRTLADTVNIKILELWVRNLKLRKVKWLA